MKIRVWKLHGIRKPFSTFMPHVLEKNGNWILKDIRADVEYLRHRKNKWTCYVTWYEASRVVFVDNNLFRTITLHREMSLWAKLKFWYYQTFYGWELTPYEIYKRFNYYG